MKAFAGFWLFKMCVHSPEEMHFWNVLFAADSRLSCGFRFHKHSRRAGKVEMCIFPPKCDSSDDVEGGGDEDSGADDSSDDVECDGDEDSGADDAKFSDDGCDDDSDLDDELHGTLASGVRERDDSRPPLCFWSVFLLSRRCVGRSFIYLSFF